jgi:hypothetical protein
MCAHTWNLLLKPGVLGSKGIKKNKKVQEKAVRMVSGLTTSTYLEKCTELKLDTLEKRRKDQALILAYKMTSEERFRGAGVLKTAGESL